MKTLFQILFLFVFCSNGFGQKTEIGVVLNSGLSKFVGDTESYVERNVGYTGEFVLGHSTELGFFLETRLGNHLKFYTGFFLKKNVNEFRLRREKEIFVIDDFFYKDTMGLEVVTQKWKRKFESHFIKIPIVFKYSFKKVQIEAGSNLLFHAYSFENFEEGESRAFLVNPAYETIFQYTSVGETFIKSSDDETNMNKVLVDLHVGLGYRIDNKFEFGLNLSQSAFDIFNARNYEEYNFKMLELKLGFKYFMIKKQQLN